MARRDYDFMSDEEKQEIDATGELNNPSLDDTDFVKKYNSKVNKDNSTKTPTSIGEFHRKDEELTRQYNARTKRVITENNIPHHYADERTYKAALVNTRTNSNNSSNVNTQQSVGVQRSKSGVKKQIVKDKKPYTAKAIPKSLPKGLDTPLPKAEAKPLPLENTNPQRAKAEPKPMPPSQNDSLTKAIAASVRKNVEENKEKVLH